MLTLQFSPDGFDLENNTALDVEDEALVREAVASLRAALGFKTTMRASEYRAPDFSGRGDDLYLKTIWWLPEAVSDPETAHDISLFTQPRAQRMHRAMIAAPSALRTH